MKRADYPEYKVRTMPDTIEVCGICKTGHLRLFEGAKKCPHCGAKDPAGTETFVREGAFVARVTGRNTNEPCHKNLPRGAYCILCGWLQTT